MTGPYPAPLAFHRAADVARMLRCSEWWVKEQARRRRIPYCWIGGGYLFTDEHVVEIVRIFEVRPIAAMPATTRRPHTIAASQDEQATTVVRLQARRPRRTRHADVPDATAA